MHLLTREADAMSSVNKQTRPAGWIGVLAATGVALYLCWLMLRPFIAVLEWAAVLVIVFYPAHSRLAQRFTRPGLAALVSTLLVIITVVGPLAFLIIALANEAMSTAQNLPAHVARLLDPETPVIGSVSKWIHDYLAIDARSSQVFIVEQLKKLGAALLEQSVGFMGNILSGIVKAFFVIFTMYYLFRDGHKIVHGLPGVLPLNIQQSETILARTKQVVNASVYGVVTIAMLQGVLGGLAFWILGVPSPILWSIILAFVCIIPSAGSFFVWLPASIYLLMGGHWTKAIILILWGTFVISTVDNFLRPKLMKDQTKLHELFVFFSVLGGVSVFGLLGIVLGPVVLAITLGLLQTLKQHDDAAKQVGARKSSLLIDLSIGLSASEDEVRTK
jgi:predicted PurR-regulated permease PerM